jgi:uncharacterized protein (DUF302 family)
MLSYGFIREINKPFVKILEKVQQELQKEGFGILTQINLKEKFKEKLGVDFKRYIILGACNPPSAFKAIEIEENIGLLLPCNVVVYEKESSTVVGMIKPTVMMGIVGNEKLNAIAATIEEKLQKVLDEIEKSVS